MRAGTASFKAKQPGNTTATNATASSLAKETRGS